MNEHTRSSSSINTRSRMLPLICVGHSELAAKDYCQKKVTKPIGDAFNLMGWTNKCKEDLNDKQLPNSLCLKSKMGAF